MIPAPNRRGVICAGRIYCDLVFSGLPAMPRLDAEVFASAMTPVLGGGAFIAAAHLAARGRPVSLLARFGTDPISLALEGRRRRGHGPGRAGCRCGTSGHHRYGA
jgi:sugar/nucleoside kinase (ribokinase family)